MQKRSGVRLTLTLLAVGLIGLAACQKQQASERPPEPGDIAVAKIDGETIWASDVRSEAERQEMIGKGEPLDPTSDLFSRTLEEVIDQRLLAKAARAKGIDRSVVAERRIRANEDRILGDMLVENTVDRHMDEKVIREQYDEQVKLAQQSEEIRARIILLKTKDDADAVLKAVQGGSLFEALAMERSIDQATRFNGGDMGYITSDIMPQAYKAAIANAKKGDTVGPVQADGGWAILRVEDRRPEQLPSLEEERPVIVRYLIYNQVAGLLKDLRHDAKVQMLIPKSALSDQSGLEPANAPGGGFSDDAASASDDTATSSASASPAATGKKGKPIAMSIPLGDAQPGSSQLVAKSQAPAG